jgi:hypothetical protein
MKDSCVELEVPFSLLYAGSKLLQQVRMYGVVNMPRLLYRLKASQQAKNKVHYC